VRYSRPAVRRFPIFLALLAGCPAAQVKDDAGKRRPTAQAFSEPSAVTTVVPISGGVFVGTSVGLDRWDDAGRRTRLGQADGIPGLAVKALALDRGQRVWYATDGGVGAYDADTQKSYPIPTSKDHAAVLASVTALAADPGGGVWLGTPTGLYHTTAKGEWVNTALKEEVTALHPAAGGTLWAGTHDGAVERNQAGVFTRYRQKAGLGIRQVSFIAEGPDGAPVVIGKDDAGQTRIAVFTDGAFSTFHLSNDFPITAATGRSGALALTSPGRLLILYTGVSPIVGLQRDGVHLVPVVGKTKKPPYNVGVFEAPLPSDVTAAATTAQRLYVGTRTLGTARFGFDQIRNAPTWLRPGELAAGAIGLFVACRAKAECYVATGGQTAWRYDGNAFAPLTIGGKGNVVLAFVRSPEGQVLALYRQPRERMLHVSRLDDGKFIPVAELKVETPSGATALSFAKFAPDKLLWLGLRYYDEENDPRPYGVAIVDLSLNAVSYHRESADDSKKTGVLPVPNDVVDVAFLEGESWFASGSGAVRLKGNQVKVWSEADDLKSEILRGLVATEGGAVYTASSAGVGEYDGQKWTYPQALAIPTNCIARSEDGRLWLGTDRGLVAYDGKTTDKIDRRAGLLDERVLDVAVDQFSRVWVRTAEGLAVVSD
jgi:hypothetical protein